MDMGSFNMLPSELPCPLDTYRMVLLSSPYIPECESLFKGLSQKAPGWSAADMWVPSALSPQT